MSIPHDVLVGAIETSLFLLPELPGLIEDLVIAGVRGRMTPLSHPLANLVGAATLDEANADSTIRMVLERFVSQQKAFGWVTGPSSTPPDLAARLSTAGLGKIEEMAGMTLTDLSTPVMSNPAVKIREATQADLSTATAMMAEAYGMPDDLASLVSRAVFAAADRIKSRAYLAYWSDGSEPVAFSFLIYLPGEPIVLLGGAATLAAYRGRGIYSSLVARRLADARAEGAQAAIIQAVRSTSAPICRNLGFSEISGLELYAWTPS